MRLIGYLPNQGRAATFSQFLSIQGIANDLEREQDGWAVWVHSEDELERARSHFRSFLAHPDAAAYRVAALTCPPLSAGDVETADHDAPRTRPPARMEVDQSWSFGLGPLTVALILACLGVTWWTDLGGSWERMTPFLIAPFEVKDGLIYWQTGLLEVWSGEIWRLLTPVFLHYGVLHLLLNMSWLLYLGSMVEGRERTGRLAWLIVVLGVVSNLGQYWIGGPNFGGMSGVVYGLLGYIWVKAHGAPSAGYRLSLNTVTFMLVWFFLCLAGVVPGVANGAHAFGLGSGLLVGLALTRRPGRKAFLRGHS